MRKNGFTLVELSIVLVIIGLLAAGIVGGQSLVDSSKRNKIVSEMNGIDTAMMAFKLEYDGIPGDFADAENYWGTASGGCPDGTRTGTQTCKGNGDGQIATTERWNGWQQLALSGIIPGTFTGRPNTSGGSTVGENQLKSAVGDSTGYEFHYITGMFGKSAHFLKLGKASPAPATGLNNGYLSGFSASSIDKKVDDGMPNSGMFVAIDSTDTAGCVTGGVVYTTGTVSSYVLTNKTASCRFYRWLSI